MGKKVADSDGALLKRLLHKTIIPLLTYVRRESTPFYSVIDEMHRRNSADCADYVQEHMKRAMHFESRPRLWDYALSKLTIDGLYGEFGVFNGSSINYLARKASAVKGKQIRLYGFDSFIGLKEDWIGTAQPRGAFDRGGKLPEVDDNVTLLKGWFDETLPPFLQQNPGPFAFIHVDCDTYEAATTVFTLLRDRIVPGTIIVMDDYFGQLNWRENEHKAWMHFVESANVQFEYIAYGIWPAAVKIIAIGGAQ